MSEAPVVYVAGPYSSDPVGNTRRAIALANHLLDLGYTVECPHLTHYLHLRQERPYAEWLRHGLAKLRHCDVMIWDSGWMPGESPGAQVEVAEADRLDIGLVFSVERLCNEYPAALVERLVG